MFSKIEGECLTKAKRAKPKEKEKGWTESFEYERFSDDFVVTFKKGMFAIDFGQGIFKPSKMFVRIWVNPLDMKMLSKFLQERIKEYEKKFGKIQ